MLHLLRKVSSVYVPPVEVLEDEKAFDDLFQLHIEKKRLMKDLIIGGVNHQEILEALEVYIGTSNMDSYIEETQERANLILSS
ncbi:hypothetical protein Xen7305DRAFT_00045460 [Xenococcus sp. PCC 7305]|uniref:hypothetical protein n=1 Tax=Xenococcus sp. PCC 7305 TaxID=102125 RepID=UPI0002ACB572|nr:hypothetical protein [Xenococcus sp. PCC 7305]ELS04810.1 hypothetical protein Xen7305DRAFT_00045460 [Xenococcus sp. PCC 7305]